MGAGSSKIENIRIEQGKEESKEKKSKVENPSAAKLENGKSAGSLSPVSTTCKLEQSSEIETLTKQLCESESQRLDLEDKVETLLKELEYANSQKTASEEKPCDETLHAKDQYISKLEKEKATLETELNKLRQRQRRKQRQFNTQMAEYKQEVNFQIMELKEEVDRLTGENKKLSALKSDKTPNPKSTSDDTPDLPGGEKMALILELSEQVAEQQDKIGKLEKKLAEKDKVVEDLRKRMKSNAQYLSALNKFKEVKEDSRIGDSSDISKDGKTVVEPPKNHLWKGTGRQGIMTVGSSQKRDSSKLKKESHVDALFRVEEESSENEEESLSKLSSLLQGVKSDPCKVTSRFDTESPLDTNNSHIRNKNVLDTEDNNGRDSGLGSAGKREDREFREMESNNIVSAGPSWKEASSFGESCSGLSDSDFEQYGSHQSKVSSAPPKLQNSRGVKLKKKSSSLKKHMSSKQTDRLPRPNIAFVEQPETLGDDLLMKKLSPFYSPVS